ncbi:MAG: sirohydrochlorin chelatase [Methylococcales symbiont of Hymedesmia sp. n. MRB-2018]|nr:MAG: sirohydrochlorin chelatase [Methylococcales symbiont of Hymedesmia sp. n. MRB-2018]KAF3983796.1 MAG: sirohydrochlorin chelatase [Methylococcales symbiont of Hymedesmia sp. n. MRB-2018]
MVTETILLVAHGSRDFNGNSEIEKFSTQWKKQHPDWRIEVCYIEFADILLDEGFDRAANNATQVLVIPLILNAAGHVKMEIPEHLEKARQRHPHIAFIYGKHLGVSMKLLAAVKRQLGRTMASLAMPDPKTTGVILLGRGSSDKIANGEVAKLARWLQEERDHELIDIAFTGITYPRLETVVQRQVKLGMTQITILPYYLFTGILISRISEQFKYLQKQYPQIRFGLGHYLGFEAEIYSLLDDNVKALQQPKNKLMMECDGCSYRAFAQDHGHGHHH